MSGCFQTDGLLIKYAWQPLKAMHRRVVTVLHTCVAISDFVGVHGVIDMIVVLHNKTLQRFIRGGLTLDIAFRPHLPSGKTTLHELQVGGARQPSLDVRLIIVCGLGASKQIMSLTYILFSRTYYRIRRYFVALARVSCAIVLNGKSFQEG